MQSKFQLQSIQKDFIFLTRNPSLQLYIGMKPWNPIQNKKITKIWVERIIKQSTHFPHIFQWEGCNGCYCDKYICKWCEISSCIIDLPQEPQELLGTNHLGVDFRWPDPVDIVYEFRQIRQIQSFEFGSPQNQHLLELLGVLESFLDLSPHRLRLFLSFGNVKF